MPSKSPAIKRELAKRELARRHLLQFTKQTYPKYQPGWIHADIAARLQRFSQAVRNKESPRLMLLVPPRHGKSELASVRFPAWHLGHCPDHEIINVGYNTELPMKFSRQVRQIFRDPLYPGFFPEAQLSPDSQSVEAWNTTQGGGFTAAGVGGGITGKGAHVLIIDDPLKNQEEADSAARRELLEEWYQSAAYTRLAPGGGVLIIETWWNDDDLAGRLQQKMAVDPNADQFEVVKYPALSESYEYRQRQTLNIVCTANELPPEEIERQDLEFLRPPDMCLHEARFPTKALKRIRANMQPRIWSALYQQNPVPDEGMYFRKEFFRYREQPPVPHGTHIYTAWDFAIGEKQQNDWTVGATLLQDEHDNLYVLEIHRLQADSFQIVESMLDVAYRWSTAVGSTYLIGVEDGQIWKAIKPMLEKRMHERGLYPPYEVLKPLTDKMARARPLQGRMQQGRVIFPTNAAWRPVMEQELLRFPAGAHDDIVDALAWAVHLCIGKPVPRPPKPPELQSWRDKLNIASEGGRGYTHMSA